MILRGTKKRVVAAAVAVVMVGASMSLMTGTAQATNPGDLTILDGSTITVAGVTTITPDCVNPGTNSSGSWSNPIDCQGVGPTSCIQVRIRANDTLTNLGMGNATQTLSNIVIDLDGTTCSPSLGTCKITLTQSKTLYSNGTWVNTGGTNWEGNFTDDNMTNVGPYNLTNCSFAFTLSVAAALSGNPLLDASFDKTLE